MKALSNSFVLLLTTLGLASCGGGGGGSQGAFQPTPSDTISISATATSITTNNFTTLTVAVKKAELQQTIEDYRRGLVPLVVPITLLRHHVRRNRVSYLEGQVYLDPHPKEMMLRNHV